MSIASSLGIMSLITIKHISFTYVVILTVIDAYFCSPNVALYIGFAAVAKG